MARYRLREGTTPGNATGCRADNSNVPTCAAGARPEETLVSVRSIDARRSHRRACISALVASPAMGIGNHTCNRTALISPPHSNAQHQKDCCQREVDPESTAADRALHQSWIVHRAHCVNRRKSAIIMAYRHPVTRNALRAARPFAFFRVPETNQQITAHNSPPLPSEQEEDKVFPSTA